MTYVPHLRLTMSGTIPGGEIFSMSVALANGAGNLDGGPLDLAPNDTQWDDLRDDCTSWFGSANSLITNEAVLKLVKIAKIGADGLYLGPPVERAVNVPGGYGAVDFGRRMPNQVACAATLHTAGDLGRVKGRFYLPSPGMVVQDDGRWSAAEVDAAEAKVKDFINNLNNEPGLDLLGLHVVVASQGRHRGGVQVVAPQNHAVTAVSIGRVPDTIRRRRNKLLESRTAVNL